MKTKDYFPAGQALIAQEVGDGNLGITAGKIAKALREYRQTPAEDDLGKYLASAGMAINRAASTRCTR